MPLYAVNEKKKLFLDKFLYEHNIRIYVMHMKLIKSLIETEILWKSREA